MQMNRGNKHHSIFSRNTRQSIGYKLNQKPNEAQEEIG